MVTQKLGLTELEAKILATIKAEPQKAFSRGKNHKIKRYQIAVTAEKLETLGLVTSTYSTGWHFYTITEAGEAKLTGYEGQVARTISPLQAKRQEIRESNGQYANVYPCEACGSKTLEHCYHDEAGIEVCEKCARKTALELEKMVEARLAKKVK